MVAAVVEETEQLAMSKMAAVLWDAAVGKGGQECYCKEYAEELQVVQDEGELKYDGVHCHQMGNALNARRAIWYHNLS